MRHNNKPKLLPPEVLDRYIPDDNNYRYTSELNKFFDKIFVINLEDNVQRLQKVAKQFINQRINFDRYLAIDGRCKGDEDLCKTKQDEFERLYNVKYTTKIKNPMERLPASALTLSHRLIYMEMISRGWDRVLICEDDIELVPDINNKFRNAIKDLPTDWDILYLGCGGKCGHKAVSYRKGKNRKYHSPLEPFYEDQWYVENKDDLREPCEKCKSVSRHLSRPVYPGGTWCFAVSIKGARKLLKYIGKNVGRHCDQVYRTLIDQRKIKAYAFDPPIAYHEEGAFRPDSNIPWKW